LNKKQVVPSKETLIATHKAMQGVSLPLAPKILLDINKKLEKDDVNLSEIAELISQDPAISGAVLKIVNSPLYSLRREIESIQQAVLILGAEKIKTQVIATALTHALGDIDPVLMVLWDESAAIAFCSMRLAVALDMGIPDGSSYMIGLFMNTGKFLLSKKYSDYSEIIDIARANPKQGIIEETSRYGSDHTLIAYLLCLSWKLPESVNLSIMLRYHESMKDIEDDELKLLHAVLVISESIVAKILHPETEREDSDAHKFIFEAIETLYLDTDVLKTVSEETDEFIHTLIHINN